MGSRLSCQNFTLAFCIPFPRPTSDANDVGVAPNKFVIYAALIAATATSQPPLLEPCRTTAKSQGNWCVVGGGMSRILKARHCVSNSVSMCRILTHGHDASCVNLGPPPNGWFNVDSLFEASTKGPTYLHGPTHVDATSTFRVGAFG